MIIRDNVRSFIVKASLVLFPVLSWVYSFRGFLSGKYMLGRDARNFFVYVNYFIYNIMHGVYPAWDPFLAWGRPNELQLRTIGELNPLLHIMTLLNAIGCSPYLSFCVFMSVYFFLGILGFYFLAKLILKSKKFAYIASVILTLSSFGWIVFTDPEVVLIFVPTVWFFYFFLNCLIKPSRVSVLGLTYTIMLIMATYIPFYFATIFLFFIVLLGVAYFRLIPKAFSNIFRFVRKNKVFVLVCAILIIVSIAPGFLWYLSNGSGEYIASGRQTSLKAAAMDIGLAQHGNFWGHTDLKQIVLGQDVRGVCPFYVPICLFLMVWLSIGNLFNKRLFILLGLSLSLFFVTLLNLTPVYAFLYKYIFFFKYFRNMHYFLWLGILPSIILFSLEHVRQILNYETNSGRKRNIIVGYMFVLHAVFFAVLYSIGNKSWTVNATILLSFIIFSAYFLGFLKRKVVLFIAILAIVVSLHPFEIFSQISKLAVEGGNLRDTVYPKTIPFSLTRPTEGRSEPIAGKIPFLSDTSGFYDQFFRGSAWSFSLQENIDPKILKRYVSHKFFVFDSTRNISPKKFSFPGIRYVLNGGINEAFVMDAGEKSVGQMSGKGLQKKAVSINEESDRFRIIHFDVNTVKIMTDFDDEKFLVYNDSSFPGWRVFVNGEKALLLQANVAFKGVWIPRGKNTVVFAYRLKRFYVYQFILMGIFAGAFLYLLYILRRDGKEALNMGKTDEK